LRASPMTAHRLTARRDRQRLPSERPSYRDPLSSRSSFAFRRSALRLSLPSRHMPRRRRLRLASVLKSAFDQSPQLACPANSELSKYEPLADDKVVVSHDLRFPPVRLTVKPERTGSRDVIFSELPDWLERC